MQPETAILNTSIMRTMIHRLDTVHERRRIAIFNGPPGIGKSTAIASFVESHRPCAFAITVKEPNASARMVLESVINELRRWRGWDWDDYIPMQAQRARRVLKHEVNLLCQEMCAGQERLTFIFDEAQNLSRSAIEQFRHWNDGDEFIFPFKVGLVFVGNNEFSLKAGASGESTISEAVADRALYKVPFDYTHVVNEDLALFIHARGVEEPGVVAALIHYFSMPRARRSLRAVADRVDELHLIAGDQPVTLETVRAVLGG